MHLTERRWFAVRTRSKHEKRAATELERLSIEYYLPLREKVKHYDGRKAPTITQLPLLTGYLFVNIRKEEEQSVIRSHYVSSFLTLGGERRQVKDAELDLLRTLSADRNLDWETLDDTFDFSEGTPVEIIKGPLAGTKGYFLDRKNKKTFLIRLGSLNACLSTCEVDPQFLAPLKGVETEQEDAANADEKRNKSLW